MARKTIYGQLLVAMGGIEPRPKCCKCTLITMEAFKRSSPAWEKPVASLLRFLTSVTPGERRPCLAGESCFTGDAGIVENGNPVVPVEGSVGAVIDLDDVGRDAPEVRLSEEDISIC